MKAGLDALPANLYGLLGLQFENLVLKNKRLLLSALSIPPEDIVREGPYFQNQTRKHAGCQIDYLVQTRHSLYIVEIKFSRSPLPSAIIEEVRSKVLALITPKHLSIRPVLVHVNGVVDAVENADYFDHVVNFGELATSSEPYAHA